MLAWLICRLGSWLFFKGMKKDVKHQKYRVCIFLIFGGKERESVYLKDSKTCCFNISDLIEFVCYLNKMLTHFSVPIQGKFIVEG